ncbi:glucokinase [[Eubacterium] cellulosolvens]
MASEEMGDKVVLTGDIGGTNTNFCVAGFSNSRPSILFKQKESTTTALKFHVFVNEFLTHAQKKQFEPVVACFAVAGPVETKEGYQRVKMTNTELIIDANDVIENTALESVLIINDFEAISYAINVLCNDDYITLNKGKPVTKGVCAVLGAGTGLGKNILHFNEKVNAYMPIPSEGGHADLPVQSDEELKLVNFIKNLRKIQTQVCYEDVLSGNGLENIYKYLRATRYPQAPANLIAGEISKTKGTNPCSSETFEWFMKFYARCARNFALDVLARGGVYIAGGIAAKNTDSFIGFFDEFVKNEVYHELLKDIPVHLLTNYDIGLIGSAYALKVQKFI